MATLDLSKLSGLVLEKGSHEAGEQQYCLLEAAAFLAGEPHSDHPVCVSPVLGIFGRDLNDRLDDTKRQQLKTILPSLLGTAGDGLDGQRGYLALDWLVRTYTPAWLDLAGLTEQAAELRALPRIVDLAAAQAAGPVVQSAADKARAKRDAAWAAAWVLSAGDAAGDAAGTAARSAARSAAWDATWDATGDAAWDATGDAAWDAAWDAAAGDAAAGALKPTVDQLQDSAIALYAEMINPAVTA